MESDAPILDTETIKVEAAEDNEVIESGAEIERETVEKIEGGIKGEYIEDEQIEVEHVDDTDAEHVEGEFAETEENQEKIQSKGEEVAEKAVEQITDEQKKDEEKKKEQKLLEEVVEEEEGYVEEPPPDPAAPFDFSDSVEALKPTFELRPDQTAEVEQIWELYQNYTPAYTDINEYITEKEVVYMLKALLLMTYTPEQLQELIAYCVRPPHPQGHINYSQFLKMVTLRQRDFPIEEELRTALQVLDPGRTGTIDREYFKELLLKQGHKMTQKQLDNLIKEVDISNDGTIGIEDVVGTMCIDLNKEDLLMLRASIFPSEKQTIEETQYF